MHLIKLRHKPPSVPALGRRFARSAKTRPRPQWDETQRGSRKTFVVHPPLDVDSATDRRNCGPPVVSHVANYSILSSHILGSPFVLTAKPDKVNDLHQMDCCHASISLWARIANSVIHPIGCRCVRKTSLIRIQCPYEKWPFILHLAPHIWTRDLRTFCTPPLPVKRLSIQSQSHHLYSDDLSLLSRHHDYHP